MTQSNRKRAIHLLGATLLAAGLSTFLFYETGSGRVAPLQLAATSPTQ